MGYLPLNERISSKSSSILNRRLSSMRRTRCHVYGAKQGETKEQLQGERRACF